jgi:hypothetical protein
MIASLSAREAPRARPPKKPFNTTGITRRLDAFNRLSARAARANASQRDDDTAAKHRIKEAAMKRFRNLIVLLVLAMLSGTGAACSDMNSGGNSSGGSSGSSSSGGY